MTTDNGTPPGWKLTKVESICDIRRGASPRPIEDPKWFADTGPGWVRIFDVTRSRRYLRRTVQALSELGASRSVRVKPGDVIMSICATIGCPVIVDMDACIHDGFVLFDNLSKDVEPEYLCYLLERESARFSSQGQKGTQGNLNTSIVKRALLLLPPRPEQQRIVEQLAAVDDAIERTRAVIDQTRKLKTALLQDLLTNGLPGRHSDFHSFDGLGTFPTSWSCVRLGTIVPHWQYGISEALADSGTLPCFRMGNLKNGRIVADGMKYAITPADTLKRYVLQRGDLLFNRTNSRDLVGRVGMFELEGDFIFASYLVQMRVDDERVNSTFLNMLLNTNSTQSQIRLLATPGVSQSNINVENMKRFAVPLPERDEQDVIVRLVNSVESREQLETNRVRLLEDAKSALSQALLTGRVRVPVKGGE